MSYECLCAGGEVDDPCEILSVKTPIARKVHKCGECNRGIMPGEKYRIEKILESGSVVTEKRCLDCESLRKTFFCDGFYYGMMWEDFETFVNECYGKISMSKVAELTLLARLRVLNILEKYWEDNDE